MGFVQDNSFVFRQAAVADALSDQNPVRHEGQFRGPLRHAIKPHLVAYFVTSQRDGPLLRDSSRYTRRGHSPRWRARTRPWVCGAVCCMPSMRCVSHVLYSLAGFMGPASVDGTFPAFARANSALRDLQDRSKQLAMHIIRGDGSGQATTGLYTDASFDRRPRGGSQRRYMARFCDRRPVFEESSPASRWIFSTYSDKT